MSISTFKLCKDLLKISVDLVPTDPITKAILKAFIESVSEQTANINQKLDIILTAPYKNGLSFLASAERVDNPALRQQSIGNALEHFVDASNKAVTALAKAQSQFYVGVCYTLLHEPTAALQWYEQAYQTGWDYRLALRESLEDSYYLRGVDSVMRTVGIEPTMRKTIIDSTTDLVNYGFLGRIIEAKVKNKQRFELGDLAEDFLIPLRELLRSKSSCLPIVHIQCQRDQDSNGLCEAWENIHCSLCPLLTSKVVAR